MRLIKDILSQKKKRTAYCLHANSLMPHHLHQIAEILHPPVLFLAVLLACAGFVLVNNPIHKPKLFRKFIGWRLPTAGTLFMVL